MKFLSSKTLAELYNCNPKDYKGIGIEKLIIASTRVLNCLRRHNIFYVDELLNCTGEEILGLYNWGRKCSEDLDAALCEFFKSFNDEINDKEELRLAARTGMFKLLENNNTKYSHETIQKYREARELLGPELVISILDGDPYIKVIFEMASKFCLNVNKNHYLDILVSEIPKSRLNTSFKKLGSIYSRNDANIELESDNDENLSSFIEKNILAYVNNDYRIKRFIDWCRYDLNSEIELYISKNVRERDYEILQCRVKGMTLEEIGEKQDVTRERIRQIEKKVVCQLSSWLIRNKYFERLMIDANVESFISCEMISNYIKKYGDVVIYVFQQSDSEKYYKDLNGFVISNKKYVECRTYVDSLPDTLNRNDFEQVLDKAQIVLNDYDELVKAIIVSEYNKTGDIYHRSRLTLAAIYGAVLDSYFQNGIHISDENEMSRFKQYVLEDYGIELNQTNRAIGTVISRVGILCNRGIYKFNSGSFISDDLLHRIYDFIITNDAPALLTNTVFNEFENELISEGIDNRYFLQGVLHKEFGDKLYFRRDYISKDNSFVNLYTQINDYIEQFDVPVDKAQIFDAFPGVTEIIVNIATSEDNIINLFGSYIHATKLKISNADVQYLHSIVQMAVEKKKTIHCKNIFYYIKKDNPTVLSNNYMFQSFCCYSVLEYFFKGEFTFDRPYIAKLGTEVERSGDLIIFSTSMGNLKDKERCKSLNDLRESSKKIVDEVALRDCHDKGIPYVMHKIVLDLVKATMLKKNTNRSNGTPEFNYQPVVECTYKDGMPMYTYGFVVYNSEDNIDDEDFPGKALQDYIWFPSDNEIYEIYVPALTHKEVNAINQLLPVKTEKEIEDKFPFIKPDSIKKYKEIWRYYPNYLEVDGYV